MSDEKACEQTKLTAEEESYRERQLIAAEVVRHLRAAGFTCELCDIKKHSH
jgi:hypothetical protein